MKKNTVFGSDISGSGGFTLIEMLIVIAIISVLAGIVLVGMTGFQASARDVKRVTQLRSAQNLIELYYAQCGYYPGSVSCGSDTAVATWAGLLTSLAPLDDSSKLPTESGDPAAKYDYTSCVSGSGSISMQKYTLGIKLEKGNAAAVDDGSQSCTLAGGGVTCADKDTLCLSE